MKKFIAKDPKTTGRSFARHHAENAPAQGAATLEKQERLAPQAVAVLGAKGGVGATTLALNLAAAFGTQGGNIALMDANFQQPDVATTLAIEPAHSIVELISRVDDIDDKMFDACRINLNNQGIPFSVLSPPLDGSAGVRLNLTQLSECFSTIRHYVDRWVIDVPRHLDKHLVTLLDTCDKIVLVFEPTIPGVAACRRWLNALIQLGYHDDRIVCVLNRSGSQYHSVEKELASLFPEQRLFRLPNAFGISWECTTMGKPAVSLHPKHAYSRSVLELAANLSKPPSA